MAESFEDSPRPAPRPAPPRPVPPPPPAPAVKPVASWLAHGAVIAALVVGSVYGYQHLEFTNPIHWAGRDRKPGPAPGPAPSPAYSGPLYAVMVLPDPPTPEQSDLRVDPPIRQAMDAHAASFRSYLATEDAVKGWSRYLTPPHDPPVVLWLREDGTLLKTTKPVTEAAVLSDVKAIRGQ